MDYESTALPLSYEPQVLYGQELIPTEFKDVPVNSLLAYPQRVKTSRELRADSVISVSTNEMT